MEKKRRKNTDAPGSYLSYDRLLAIRRQNDIIAMLLDGKKIEEIRRYVLNRFDVKPSTVGFLISKAHEEIKKRKDFEVDNLISLHIERYERIFEGLYELGAYSKAAQALNQKERLMGFHKEGFHMKVTQGEIQQLNLKNVNDEYNLRKLGDEKNMRIVAILEKAKRDAVGKKPKQITE